MTEGVSRMPNRAMLRAVGFTDADFDKPIIGIASAGSEVTPCNVHLDDLAAISKAALKEAGGAPMKFNTFVVTDGEAMGHEGMKCSLVEPGHHSGRHRARGQGPPDGRHPRDRRV